MRIEELGIRAEAPFSIKRVKELRLCEQEGEHAHLLLAGVLDEEEKHSLSVQSSIHRPIRIYGKERGEDESEEVLIFCGVIENIQTRSYAEIYTFELEAVSYSVFADIQRWNESFQCKEHSYQDVLDKVRAKDSRMDILPTIDISRKIPAPLLQYEETDWQFIKRLVSHFNTKLYVDCKQERPSIVFGLPNAAKKHEIEEGIEYTIDKDMLAMEEAELHGEMIASDEFLRYSIEVLDDYRLGDQVIFLGKELRILRKESYLKGSLMHYRYSIGRDVLNYQIKQYNERAFGLRLEGRVLDTKGECVKVHLHIDEKQPIDEAYWFPFAPPTGSLMYCMPQHGTEVSVYFPELNENEAMTYGCVRRNGQVCPKTANPDIRYLGTEHGSELEMAPPSMHFNGKQETDAGLNLTLADALGVSFTTPSTKMTIEGKEGVLISSAKTVNLTGAQVSMTSESDGNVVIDGEVNIIANAGKTYFDGSDASSFESLNEDIVFISQAQVNAAKAAEKAAKAAMDARMLEEGLPNYKLSDPTYDAYGEGEVFDIPINKIEEITNGPEEEREIITNSMLQNALRQVYPDMPNDHVAAIEYLQRSAAMHGLPLDNATIASQQLLDLCNAEAAEAQTKVSDRQKRFAETRSQNRWESVKTAAGTEGIGAAGAYPFLYELSDPYNSIYIHEEGTPGIANSKTVPAYLANERKKNGDIELNSLSREVTLATQQAAGSAVTGELDTAHLERMKTQGTKFGTGDINGLILSENMLKTLQAHVLDYQGLVNAGGLYALQERSRRGAEFFGNAANQFAWAAIIYAQLYAKPGNTTAKRKAKSETKKPSTPEQLEKQAEGMVDESAKTSLDHYNDIRVENGKYYTDNKNLNEIGKAEAKGQDFSALSKSQMSVRASTEGGTSAVYKYSDSTGTKFVIHEVTNANGSIIHRDFDVVRIQSGQSVHK